MENTIQEKKWLTIPLLVFCLAAFITALDSTLLNVSIPTLVREFHTSLPSLQWVISAYSLVLAALMITGGRLGDFFGRKKIFMIGAALFAVGSFITSISHSVPVLIFGESIIEGLGAALMVPATAALIVTNFTGENRAKAFGVWTGLASVAVAVGPILGGWLTTNYTWRYGFRINIFVVVALLIGCLFVKDSKGVTEKPQIDFPGILLSAAGFFLIVFGLIQSTTYGWLSLIVPVSIICGVVSLALFVSWERKREESGKTPLISSSVFKNKKFFINIFILFILYLGLGTISFFIPIFFQGVNNASAFHIGLSLIPYSISIFVGSQFAAYLVKWTSPLTARVSSMIVAIIGLLILRNEISVVATFFSTVPGLLIYGLGVGSIMPQLTNLIMSSVPAQESGESSGIYNTMRYVGLAFSVAITGTILVSGINRHIAAGLSHAQSVVYAGRHMLWFNIGFAAAALILFVVFAEKQSKKASTV